MSRSWSKGSTRRWRKVRAGVLAQAGYRCQLRLPGVCIVEAPLRGRPGVPAGHAHHPMGKAAGDDPRYLVAACAPCNLHVGDPTKAPDPQPKPRTRW